ncbi:hypothetical protein B7468_05335 [Staphylococcus lugdunensis]|nr:hypothetical protein B7468_05335 [Staphylococcus lugdunensis]
MLFVGAHPNLLCLVKCFSHFSLLGPHPQLALSVGFLFESLFVGAPVFTCLVLQSVLLKYVSLICNFTSTYLKKAVSILFQ